VLRIKITSTRPQIVFSVKSGHLKNEYVRELPGILDREKAQIGVLITLESPTQPMRKEAASAGFYSSPWGTSHPKLQILTVQELLGGRQEDMPPSQDFRTFKKAPKAKRGSETREQTLTFGDDDD
jgi:site-specific DNA-methyltransferase (adenine-specific)